LHQPTSETHQKEKKTILMQINDNSLKKGSTDDNFEVSGYFGTHTNELITKCYLSFASAEVRPVDATKKVLQSTDCVTVLL
jgi:hypothetical protein